MTFLPPDAGVAYSFLEIIADPNRAKKYLDELVAKTQDLQMAGETARADRIAADAALTEAAQTLQRIKDFHNHHDTDYARQNAALKDRENSLAKRAADLNTKEDTLRTTTAEFLRDKEIATNALLSRSTQLSAREKELAEQEKKARDLKETLEARLATLKAAMA